MVRRWHELGNDRERVWSNGEWVFQEHALHSRSPELGSSLSLRQGLIGPFHYATCYATMQPIRSLWRKHQATIKIYDSLGLKTRNNLQKEEQKTYNSGDSLVVTDPTTNQPLTGLSMGERTGSRVFQWVWSYVPVSRIDGIIKSSVVVWSSYCRCGCQSFSIFHTLFSGFKSFKATYPK